MFLGGGDPSLRHSPGLISSYLVGEEKSTKNVPTSTVMAISIRVRAGTETLAFVLLGMYAFLTL
jgi:hypothetical protein